MVIFETSIFIKQITDLLKGEEYRALQNHLVDMPEAGKVVTGSGGIRKVRWAASGRGKRGGARILYYLANRHNQIFMLYAYANNEREDLTKDQLSVLKKAVATEFEDER